MELFGNQAPFAEPSWNSGFASPYYTNSHRKLATLVRNYLDEHIVDNVVEWEEKGSVPQEERLRFAQAGLAFQDMPAEYAGGVTLPGGISSNGMVLKAYRMIQR